MCVCRGNMRVSSHNVWALWMGTCAHHKYMVCTVCVSVCMRLYVSGNVFMCLFWMCAVAVWWQPVHTCPRGASDWLSLVHEVTLSVSLRPDSQTWSEQTKSTLLMNHWHKLPITLLCQTDSNLAVCLCFACHGDTKALYDTSSETKPTGTMSINVPGIYPTYSVGFCFKSKHSSLIIDKVYLMN